MVLENYYFWFKNVIPSNVCNDIIKFATTQNKTPGLIHGEEKFNNSKKSKEGLKLRDSDVVWLRDEWVFQELHPFAHEANKMANWNFELDRSESVQFTIYGKNQHYGWHVDANAKVYDCPNDLTLHGKTRKLSMSVILNDPKEYKGGEFEIEYPTEDKKGYRTEIVKQLDSIGSVLVFPSFVRHRVRPVTKGVRYSAVIWFIGRPFK